MRANGGVSFNRPRSKTAPQSSSIRPETSRGFREEFFWRDPTAASRAFLIVAGTISRPRTADWPKRSLAQFLLAGATILQLDDR